MCIPLVSATLTSFCTRRWSLQALGASPMILLSVIICALAVCSSASWPRLRPRNSAKPSPRAGLLLTAVEAPDGSDLGHLACEYSGHLEPAAALKQMLGVAGHMAVRRGFGLHKAKTLKFGQTTRTTHGYRIRPARWIVSSTVCEEKAAVVIAGIGFVSFRSELPPPTSVTHPGLRRSRHSVRHRHRRRKSTRKRRHRGQKSRRKHRVRRQLRA